MAVLRFLLYDTDDNTLSVDSVISYELSKNVDAPCDGLRLTFIADKPLNEINRVEAYQDDALIFNGFCDTQRESISDRGYECFVYARSSACILIDNEAKPFTYNHPSARSLFIKNACDFGFVYSMPEIFCESAYQVSKGCSCFAAINNFVYGITGRNMLVSVNNELILSEKNNTVRLNNYRVISEKRIINRGNAITAIDYKAYDEVDYTHHIKSRFFDERKINRTIKLNVSSLAQWQREYTLINTLKAAGASYNTIELIIDGNVCFSLYDDVIYNSEYLGDIKDYYISSMCIISDKKGERTRLTLSKNIDLKEIVYVAE